jgi:hypothetical protein
MNESCSTEVGGGEGMKRNEWNEDSAQQWVK